MLATPVLAEATKHSFKRTGAPWARPVEVFGTCRDGGGYLSLECGIGIAAVVFLCLFVRLETQNEADV